MSQIIDTTDELWDSPRTAAAEAAAATDPPLLLVKRRTVTLAGVPAGMQAQVLGLAADDTALYATLYHNPPDKPKESPEPGHLLLLDKRTLGEAARIGVGYSPRAVAVDPGRKRAYVLNWGVATKPDTYGLSVVDLASRTEIARLPLPAGLADVAVDRSRDRVYVTGWISARLHVIDGATLSELASVTLGKGLLGVAVDEPAGLVYVTRTYHSGAGFPDADELIVLDGKTDRHPVVATLPLAPGAQPRSVRVRGDRVFVGTLGSPAAPPHIAVFQRDGTSFTRLADLPTHGAVVAVDIAPKSTTLYDLAGGKLRAVRTDTGHETGALPQAGTSPQAVAVDGASGVIYVGHGGDGRVSRHLPLPKLGRFNVEEHLGLVDEPVKVAEGIWDLGPGIPPDQRRPRPTNVSAADTTNTDQIRPGGSMELDLDGSGVTVGIWEADDGDGDWRVRATHQEFGGRVTIDPGDVAGTPDGGFSDHATHVAGTVAAAGVDPRARGMASAVHVLSFSADDEAAEMAAAASNPDPAQAVVVTNHSYGHVTGWEVADERDADGNASKADYWHGDWQTPQEDLAFGRYSSKARALDEMLYAHPRLLSVWSAGNDRLDHFTNARGDDTYLIEFASDPGLPGLTWTGSRFYRVSTAVLAAPQRDGNQGSGYDLLGDDHTTKNSLVIGAINDITKDPYHDQDVRRADFSSAGPTDDGRIKPDLVANGVDLYSSTSGSDSAYGNKSGTSMAAPNVSGTAALLVQHHRDLFGGATPLSATLKGILVHTASNIAGQPGPDYVNGWGVVNAAEAATFMRRAAAGERDTLLQEADYQGAAQVIPFVSDGNGVLKVTVVWNDPAPAQQQPGTLDTPASAYKALVNDLDLRVDGPDGTSYFPWTLDPTTPGDPARADQPNHVDNVEQVVIYRPQPGEHKIVVSHTGQPFTQPYTLLVSQTVFTGQFFEGGAEWVDSSVVTSIALGDVDGDGLLEIGVTKTGFQGPRWYIFDDAQAGFRLLASGGHDWAADQDATSIAFGDVDGDGLAEVGLTRNADTTASWFILDDAKHGFAQLHEGGAEWGPGRFAISIAFGDVDDDQHDEIGVVRRTDDGDSYFVYDDKDAGFAELLHGGAEWGDDRHATSIAFGDVDDDQRAEVGITRNSDTNSSFYIFDDKDAGFALLKEGGAEWGPGQYATQITFGDVDGDRRAEVGVVRTSEDNDSYFVYDDKDAGFAELLHGGAEWGHDRYAVCLGFGDFDGDQRDELVVGRRSDGPRYYIRDDAEQGFKFLGSGGRDWGDGRFPVAVAFGDLDGDTAEEMALARYSETGPRFYILG